MLPFNPWRLKWQKSLLATIWSCSKTTRPRWQRQVSFLGHQSRHCQTGWEAGSWVSCPYLRKSSVEFCETVPWQKKDVEPCYQSLNQKFRWRHEACDHSKGLFCVKQRISNKTVLIHTGGVDAMWRLSKSAIPCSLSTRSNGHANPKLMQSIRVWQWRWMNSKAKGLLELTGRALKKRMAM